MNRIKVNLIYNSKAEYEDMIRYFKKLYPKLYLLNVKKLSLIKTKRRHENSMRNQSRGFSRIEEARVLNDIKQLKSGMIQLEQYDHLKNSFDKLTDSFNRKKLELDDAWKLKHANIKRLAVLDDEDKSLSKQIYEIKLDLDEMTKRRVEMKKTLEDLIRENIVRQQKARKKSTEKIVKKNRE